MPHTLGLILCALILLRPHPGYGTRLAYALVPLPQGEMTLRVRWSVSAEGCSALVAHGGVSRATRPADEPPRVRAVLGFHRPVGALVLV